MNKQFSIQKDHFSDRIYIIRSLESKLEDTVNSFQYVDFALDAAKQNEELQDRPLERQEEDYLCLPIASQFCGNVILVVILVL